MPTSTPGNRERGFNLFELMVVLLLLGLSLAVVMPSFSRGMKGLELQSTGRNLITHMKQARSWSIARQKVFRVILFQGEPSGGEAGRQTPDFYVLADEFEQQIKRFELPEGISIRFQEGELPVKVNFYPNGRSSGQFLELENLQGRRIRIEVDPITGFARVLKEDDRG